jgi:Kef-type K+ transport system membrane component KefB
MVLSTNIPGGSADAILPRIGSTTQGNSMQGLSEEALLLTLVAIAVILIIGRGTAEVARRLGQPEVLGELLGGVLLGPSVLGTLFPGPYHTLFLNGTVSQGLSLLSWLGAILLLFIAGWEVDLPILRQNAHSGMLAAAGAIIPSIAAGTIFARVFLKVMPPGGLFLGLVLSVTAVSVAAKLLIERDALRRSYAQVILAGGMVSEVVVWLLISVVAAFKAGEGVLGVVQSFVIVAAFFGLMMTLGRRFTFWAMRRTADLTQIANGELSLVLVLMLVAAAITEWLGLHALLGAFVFGVLLSQAPRATTELRTRVQTLTISLFAPIFFVLAGMRVNVFQLGSPAAIGLIFVLLLAATAIKVGMGTLGARLGGLRPLEALLVGIGLDLKGGTDVIVAIVGVQLALLSVRLYTIYTVVAILTVLVAPPLIALLEARVPPSHAELERLNREEARRRAYLPHLERVLVPVAPDLLSDRAAALVEQIAHVKQDENEIFDITQLVIADEARHTPALAPAVAQVEARLNNTEQGETAELTRRHVQSDKSLPVILAAAADHDLVAIGAAAPNPARPFTFGRLQDQIVHQSPADVLVTVAGRTSAPHVGRILVAVNGFAHSLAAGDVAAYLAKATGAELVLFTSVRTRLDGFFWRDRGHRRMLQSGYELLRELGFRVGRLGIATSERVVLERDAGLAIIRELQRQSYDLVVMGAMDRSTDEHLYVGSPIETVLMRGGVPAVVLVARGG